jgi:hypothetical protein
MNRATQYPAGCHSRATALTAAFGASGVASIVATVLMQDYTNRDIWEETV